MSKDFLDLVARDIMKTRLVTLDADTDVFKGIQTLMKHKISGAPVVDHQRKLLGVFSEKCSMQVLMDAVYGGLPTNKLGVFMDTQPQTVPPETTLFAIANLFLLTPRRRLPVVKDGILIGQISRRDVIAAAAKSPVVKSSHSKQLLYLSALRQYDEAPAV